MEKPFEKLKRLESELKNAKDSGEFQKKFTLYLDIGEMCFDIEATELGIKYIEEAIDLGKKNSKLFKFKHLFYKNLGDLYFKQGSLNEAYEIYKKAIKEIPKKESYDTQAVILLKMGKILAAQDKKKAAISVFKDSEKFFFLSEEYASQARVLNEIGITYTGRMIVGDSSILERITGIERYNMMNDVLESKAKKSFKKAYEILKQHNLLETENELAKKFLSNLR